MKKYLSLFLLVLAALVSIGADRLPAAGDTQAIQQDSLTPSLNSLDPNMLFSKWYNFEGFLTFLKKYPHIQATRTFLVWFPGRNRTQDNIDTLPYAYDLKAKKYIISRWSDDFKARFKYRVEALCAANKHVIISLVDYCSWREAEWDLHPWNPKNNVEKAGESDWRISRWTGPNMKLFWYPLIDNIFANVDPKYHKQIIIEAANEPTQNLDVVNDLVCYATTKKGIPRDRMWLSIGEDFIQKFREARGDGWFLQTNVGVVSVHGVRDVKDADRLITDVAKACRGIRFRPDSDGAKYPTGGTWLTGGPHNLTGMKPEWIKGVIAKYGSFGVMLHADDGHHTPAQWADTWKCALPLAGAF